MFKRSPPTTWGFITPAGVGALNHTVQPLSCDIPLRNISSHIFLAELVWPGAGVGFTRETRPSGLDLLLHHSCLPLHSFTHVAALAKRGARSRASLPASGAFADGIPLSPPPCCLGGSLLGRHKPRAWRHMSRVHITTFSSRLLIQESSHSPVVQPLGPGAWLLALPPRATASPRLFPHPQLFPSPLP